MDRTPVAQAKLKHICANFPDRLSRLLTYGAHTHWLRDHCLGCATHSPTLIDNKIQIKRADLWPLDIDEEAHFLDPNNEFVDWIIDPKYRSKP